MKRSKNELFQKQTFVSCEWALLQNATQAGGQLFYPQYAPATASSYQEKGKEGTCPGQGSLRASVRRCIHCFYPHSVPMNLVLWSHLAATVCPATILFLWKKEDFGGQLKGPRIKINITFLFHLNFEAIEK